MSATIIMPQLGETVAEGKILTWFKAVGDAVKQGDRLFEVETDKVTVEVEAVEAGILGQILVPDGATAKVGAVVAVIGEGSALPAAERRPSPPTETPARPAPAVPRSVFEEVSTPLASYGVAKVGDDLRITPLARRLLKQHNLDLAGVADSVRKRNGRRIYEDDVKAALTSRGAAPAVSSAPSLASAPEAQVPAEARPAATTEGDGAPLSAIRQKTAERLAGAWRTIPHVFQAIDVDFSQVDAARSAAKNAFKAATGVSLTFLPFIARATCIVLKEFPNVNARFDGESLTLFREVNLGIAVDLGHKGLMVPVVRSAGDYAVAGLAKAIARQVDKARAGKLTVDDLTGGTYSITNNGAFGTMFTSPIINAPQVAILSTDAIRKRPVVVESAEGTFIAPRLVGIIGQSFDHRVIDGAYSAAFLSRLKTVLEQHNWWQELAS